MEQKASPSYQTKLVSFGGKTITMYSIDGVTWSTRKDELLMIKERQENEKTSLKPTAEGFNRGPRRKGAPAGPAAAAPLPVGDDDYGDTPPDDDIVLGDAPLDDLDEEVALPVSETALSEEPSDSDDDEVAKRIDEELEIFEDLGTGEKNKTAVKKSGKKPLKAAPAKKLPAAKKKAPSKPVKKAVAQKKPKLPIKIVKKIAAKKAVKSKTKKKK